MARPPLLLAAPTAFAGLPRTAARVLLVVLALLVLAAIGTGTTPAPEATPPAGGHTDVALYGGIVEGVRHGGDYYTLAADAMRAGDYPLRPFFTMRLPTLAVASAALPARLPAMLLAALALAVVLAWWERFRPLLARLPARIAAVLLLLAGVFASFQPPLPLFHEAWAGLFIALSLARWRPGRAIEAIGWALAAALIRETAIGYLLVMAAFALVERRRREAGGWLAAIAVAAVVLAAHAVAVGRVTGPLDAASPGWDGLLGIGFAGRSLATSTALVLLPPALAAALLPLSLAGWAAWRDPLGRRTTATLAGYAALLALFARADNFYWALMLAPVALAGLVFLPDGLRDLARAALDTRRITVRRVAR
jgi:hypothetical protein